MLKPSGVSNNLSRRISEMLTCLEVRNNLGPAPDDILLGEFGNKIDED